MRYVELRPGDQICYSISRKLTSLLVISVVPFNEGTGFYQDDGVNIMYLALCGTSWSGIQTFCYTSREALNDGWVVNVMRSQ